MLTFRWKYETLKQIDVIKGSRNAWDIFTGLDPRLSHVPKRRPHKSLRKRTVVINIEYVVSMLIVLRPKYCLENVENSISKHLNFKIFCGGISVETSTSKLIDSTGIPKKSYNTMANGEMRSSPKS